MAKTDRRPERAVEEAADDVGDHRRDAEPGHLVEPLAGRLEARREEDGHREDAPHPEAGEREPGGHPGGDDEHAGLSSTVHDTKHAA